MNLDMKILVVDDSSLMRGFAKSSLKQLKLNNVTEAEDGVEALAELKKALDADFRGYELLTFTCPIWMVWSCSRLSGTTVI